MVALLIIASTCSFLAPLIVAEAAPIVQVDDSAMIHDIVSLGKVTGPMIEVNETTTTETPPPELNPITIGLIGGVDVGIVIALIFFIVKRK
jgi:hypothetical protein